MREGTSIHYHIAGNTKGGTALGIEVEKMSEPRQNLHNFIDKMPEMYVEKALKILSALIEPTGGEIETENMKKWWADNIASKPPVKLDLSEEELLRIKEDEVVSWEEFEKECDSNE